MINSLILLGAGIVPNGAGNSLISFASGVLVPLLIFYLKHRSKVNKNKNTDIVVEALEIRLKNQAICDEIRTYLDASRVNLFKFSNGTDFIDNTHMLNITMVNESNDNDSASIKNDFAKISASTFDRGLNLLKVNEYVVSNEDEFTDNLANLNKNYDIVTTLTVKVLSKEGKWSGVLLVAYDKHKNINPDETAWVLLKSKQLH